VLSSLSQLTASREVAATSNIESLFKRNIVC
jgi:hypothetical protein